MANQSRIPKVAFVGTNFGCLAHVRALHAAGFDVHALVGRNVERTRTQAKAFDVPHALTSYEDALAIPGLEAVIIASPPATHKPLALQAIAAGKHVLCEKPLALTAADAREMRDAADRAGVVHMVQHQFRFRPQDVALRHIVQDGRLGELRQASFLLDGNLCSDPACMGLPDWWRDARTGGGFLRNYAAHQIDLIRYTLGEFESISAELTIGTDRGLQADDGCTVLFRLQNGLRGMLQGSFRAWEFAHVARIIGADGTASVEMDPKVFQFDLWITDHTGKHRVAATDLAVPAPREMLPVTADTSAYDSVHNVVSGSPEYALQAMAFLKAIRGEDAGPVQPATFADGVAHMAIIETIERSALENRRLNVDPTLWR